jgi:hypothetical protein|tara:strand:- start:87 stop:248 length:162 start_codon:yes stop_codon:yes gene_type:complete
MPKVGTKSFPYTSAGVAEAQAHAKNTGQKMSMMKKGGKTKHLNKGGSVKSKKK